MRKHHWTLTALLLGALNLQAADLKPGVVGEYFSTKAGLQDDDMPAGKKPFFVQVDKQIKIPENNNNFNGSKLDDQFFVRWNGFIRIDKAGEYQFTTESDDGSRLYIKGERVVDNWGPHSMTKKSGKVTLEAGDHPIKVAFEEGGGGAGCIVYWTPPGGKQTAVPAKASTTM